MCCVSRRLLSLLYPHSHTLEISISEIVMIWQKLYLVVEIHSWSRNNWPLRFLVFLQNFVDNADSFPN